MKYCLVWHNRKLRCIEPAFVGRNAQLDFKRANKYSKKDIKFFNSRDEAHACKDDCKDVITEEEADLLLAEWKLKCL